MIAASAPVVEFTRLAHRNVGGVSCTCARREVHVTTRATLGESGSWKFWELLENVRTCIGLGRENASKRIARRKENEAMTREQQFVMEVKTDAKEK